MEKATEADFANYTFPNLTEITGFLLLYRINGLKTLVHLFPNLRVIRGEELVSDYALVVYEMQQLQVLIIQINCDIWIIFTEIFFLQEIGLKSLVQITRGAVRVEKNPSLCFVETIDWSRIAINSEKTEHIFAANKPQDQCPICPSGKRIESGSDLKDNGNSLECPVSSSNPKQHICWNLQNCQIVCPAKCGNRTCTSRGECCDESCLICTPGKSENCEICRTRSIGNYRKRTCVEKCPKNLYSLHNRRCVNAEVCRKTSKPVYLRYELSAPDFPFIPINGECTLDCPADHYATGDSEKRYCQPCKGRCLRSCPSGNIDSIAAAQLYRGCTYIDGPLLIQIRSQGGRKYCVFKSFSK